MGLSGSVERVVAGRWIAGPRIEDAVRRSRQLNARGMQVILNYLGEALSDADAVRETLGTYHMLVKEINANKLMADISVKPTELGMSISPSLASKNYLELIGVAKKHGVFVWMDMEELETVGGTLALYKKGIKSGNTGLCIQSYLRRSMGDLGMLARAGATIRLVKGAYGGPAGAAFQTRAQTTENYYTLMDYLFRHFKRFTIGTHDVDIIEKALKLNKRYKREVTYAMLNGIRNGYALDLAQMGQNVSIYVPFGERWASYAYRRLKEMRNMKLAIMSMFERQI